MAGGRGDTVLRHQLLPSRRFSCGILLAFRLLLVFGLGILARPALALEPVTLQLRWQHQFQFAGYYAAQMQGYYRDAGLAVDIRESRPGLDVADTVMNGEAQYGVGNSDLLLRYHRGSPVLVLAVIFQHSPLAIAARRQSGIRNVHDLAGKRLALEGGATELAAYLGREGVDLDSLIPESHGHNLDDLLAGRVDALSIYVTDELFQLRSLRDQFLVFSPDAGGVDFYGDNLFTSRNEWRDHPERVRAFREASLKGWRYAMAHPGEVVDYILQNYGPRHSREHLMFEAEQMIPLVQAQLVEPGYFHPGRWQYMARAYAELGLLPRDMKVDEMLYRAIPPDEAAEWRPWSAALAGAGLGAALLYAFLFRQLRRLRGARTHSQGLMECAPFPVAVTRPEPNGALLYINRCAEEYYGVSRADVIGRPAEGFWRNPEQRQQMIDELRQRGGRWLGFEVQLQDLQGKPAWVLMSAALIDFEGDEAIVLSFHDITQRKVTEAALRRSEQRFRTLAESAYDVIWTMDLTGRFTYVSPSVQRLRGYTPEEVMQQSMAEALTPDSMAQAAEGFAHLLRTGQVLDHHWELEQPCKDGSTVWTDAIINVLRDEEGHMIGLIGVTRDITAERKLRQELLSRSVAVDAAAEGVIITDANGVVEYANPAFCDMTGYAASEVIGQRTSRFKSGIHDKDFYRQLWGTITSGNPWRGEVVNRRKDGMLYHELLTIAPVKDENGAVVRYVAIKHDISERKRIEQRLEHLAHFDLLTDLPNRTLFFDRLQQAFARSQRYQEGLAVMMLDLDGFKAVNDTLGHQAGDLLLAAFAYRLKQTLRQSDTAARMGGDEFTVLLHGIRQDQDALTAAAKILSALEQPFDILGNPCRVGASIGVALFQPGYPSADALLQAADGAMYAAKRAGKNGCVLAQAPAQPQSPERPA
ncbi:hypothetical protein AZSI13_31900 [Azospira sp. I13]|nr:hypothetical protein AZSI13_31900 [Azospira sp. I13]